MLTELFELFVVLVIMSVWRAFIVSFKQMLIINILYYFSSLNDIIYPSFLSMLYQIYYLECVVDCYMVIDQVWCCMRDAST